MEFQMKKRYDRADLPERLQYTKYYEHDGMLRAYANRAMVLAMLFAVIASASLGFAIYVRVQPPTVVRVDADGRATAIGSAQGGLKPLAALAVQASADQNLATALNMMTSNLRTYSLGKLRDDDTVGKIKEDRITSQLLIRTIEPVKSAPWTYVIFGVKEIHRVRQRVESTDRIVGRYNVRLVEDRRSESNPSGLLVAEFSEQQMVGERDGDLLQQSQLLEK